MSKLTTFQFVGGPIDTKDDSAPLFEAIGYAATSWARLEQQIDALLIHVNSTHHSATLYNPEHPVAFKNKIRLLKRWFNNHPGLQQDADHIREMTSRLKTIAPMRNTYLHSIVEAYDHATQTATLRSIKFEGNDTFKISEHKATIEEIVNFAVLTNLANRWLWSLSSEIFTPDGLARLRKP